MKGENATTKKGKYYWINERHNPQIGIYYIAYGRISTAEAKKKEQSIYGQNYLHKFNTKKEYLFKIKEIEQTGVRIKRALEII